MEKQVVEKMFSLVNSVVFNEQLEQTSECFFEGEQLNKVYNLAKKHDISHIVSHAILQNNLIDANEKVKFSLTKEKLVALFRSENTDYLIDLVTKKLEEAGIDFILLKGAFIRNLYPERWLRTNCDIDVLVKKECVDKAIAVLCEDNTFTRGNDSTTHDCLLIAQSGMHLELHYTLEEEEALPKTTELLNKAWDNAVLEQGYKHKYNFNNEFFIFYHIAHMAKHFIHGGCGIRPFIDLKFLLENLSFDKEKLTKMLAEAQIYDFYNAVCDLAKMWLSNGERTPFLVDLEQFVLSGGVYGTHENNAKVSASKGKSKISTFISIVFLPKKRLEVIYPNLKKHPILFPFYQVKRWFRVFYRKKVKKVKRAIDARASVTNEQIDQTTQLLQQLGLSE